jgi:DNA-binding transcriptional MerR regulator
VAVDRASLERRHSLWSGTDILSAGFTLECAPRFTLGSMDLTVSKLAREVGLTADTVRYYEKAGLLPAPARTPAGYRVYHEDDVERLRFIRGAQRIGLRLREIKELLDIGDRGLCPCGHTESLLDRRTSEVDREIASLKEIKRELLAFRERFAAIDCPPGVEPWPCADVFVAAADGDRKGVNHPGRNPVVPTHA